MEGNRSIVNAYSVPCTVQGTCQDRRWRLAPGFWRCRVSICTTREGSLIPSGRVCGMGLREMGLELDSEGGSEKIPLGCGEQPSREGSSFTTGWQEGCTFTVVQLLSLVRLSVTPWTAARQAPLSIVNSRSLLKLMSIESVMPSNHLILCRPLLLLPTVFSSIRIFSSELIFQSKWPKYWSFGFSISPSSEYSELISFRMDCCISLRSKGLEVQCTF